MLDTPYRQLYRAYLLPRWPRLALLAALLLGITGLELLNPQIVRYFIDTAQAGGAVSVLVRAAALFLGVALLGQAVRVAETYVAENLGWSATNALRGDLAAHCLDLDLSFHHAHTPGELIERIDGDVTALANFFSRFVIQVIGSGLLLLGALALLLREDWRAGALLLAFSVMALIVMSRARSMGARYALAARAASAALFGFLEERLAGLIDIQAVGARDYVLYQLRGHLRELFQHGRASMLAGSALYGATESIFTIATAAVLALGVYLYHAGAMSVGAVYLIVQYTAMLRQPVRQLTRQARDFQNASASITRVQQLYAVPRSLVDGTGRDLPDGPLAVEFQQVSFAYAVDAPGNPAEVPGGAERVLHGVSFRVPPGTVLGVLGRTGSGKTTIARLLCRLDDPTEGAVLVGGRDVRDLRLADLHRRVGLVTQEVQIFGASVRDNLTLFRPSIPDEQIVRALAELGLGAWYLALPDGLDTELAPGGQGLSAGEAQLLAFARVFLRDPAVVVLDEASSRLDAVTERQVERAVDRLLAGRTGIIIAHRLATVRRADAILILEDGQIVEEGPREALARDPRSRFASLLQTGLLEVRA
ncbi:MAG TPA: ABC transporter ATP-binding protein [Thermomicrobiales bacterium]|nr:ABC transporter ATP-binding protein [Thermomicrobiales bacterium]